MVSIEEFDEKIKVGDPVNLELDNGDLIPTHLRHSAWDLCGTTVAMVEGKSGGYDAERIHPRSGI